MTSNSQKIRVLIVDDHEILRMGLSIFLASVDDMILVGEAVNGQQALELCAQLHPDVVLMDIVMPVMDGLTATSIIARDYPFIGVVVLTSSFSEEREQQALEAGAHGYLRKTADVNALANAIRAAVH